VENDTKAAAIAEHLFGSCQGVADFVLLHGGSGVGGALFLQGALYHGIGLGGELGHMKVFPHGRPCSCGGNGCLEAYVSEPAIRARLAENGRSLPDAAALDAAAVQRCAADPAVRAVLEDAGRVLGLAMANLINLLNPKRIVLAGSLAALSGAMLANAQSALVENVLPAMGSAAEIKVSELGADAVALGGVGLAMEGFLPLFGKLDGRWAVRAQAAPAQAP
jgi:predicted NBD/HSP70 family sugar kinase